MIQRRIELIGLLLLFLSLGATAAGLGGLIGAATSQLGVNEQQASGGMGALLGAAKQNLGGDKYGELLSMVPSLSGLAGSAATTATGSSGGGLLGAAASALGGGSGLGQAAQLAETFQGLGLSPDMVGRFAQVALDYVQGEGGAQAMELLKSGLDFL
ncbi:MAG TPA: DUF2780 domain-containing protein [Sedimenticola sp.]|nr:DUF2780 domain-containing protein [Sedimenticola sp.]